MAIMVYFASRVESWVGHYESKLVVTKLAGMKLVGGRRGEGVESAQLHKSLSTLPPASFVTTSLLSEWPTQLSTRLAK